MLDIRMVRKMEARPWPVGFVAVIRRVIHRGSGSYASDAETGSRECLKL
jgi:hypothetical protein